MNSKETKTDVVKLKRYFAVAGLASTMVASILLVAFYRHMAINDIIDLGERNNMVLAKTVLNPVKSDLIDYLITVKDTENLVDSAYDLPSSLEKAIQDAMADTSVVRTKIYNQNGIVVFSTKPGQIGKNKSDNPQFIAAIDGQVASKILYNDAFSLFHKASEEDNLIQSYVPVRLNVTSPVYGVFEIYTDVNSVASRVERTGFIVFLGVIIILFLLYVFLSYIVRRAATTMSKQQSIIRERTRTLEYLSSKMLHNQEEEKKKIAENLHEDFIQTLASVKHNIEIVSADIKINTPDIDYLPLTQGVNILQGVIQKVRSYAMEIHPSSIDEFGLINTISKLCEEYQLVYPKFKIDASLEIDEAGLPDSLKILIYRLIQEALVSITSSGQADSVKLNLYRSEEKISLSVEDNAIAYYSTNMAPDEDSSDNVALAVIKERTLLSGGSFTIDRTRAGGTLATASWTRS